VVTDQTRAVVPDAHVEIRNLATGTTQSTKTNEEGVYRFFFLAPGNYALAVTRTGFNEATRTVDILLGLSVSVNVILEVSKVRSEVIVTDEVPLIQAENGDVSATMNQKQISEVPNPGNDLTYIAQTAPGVVMNTDGGLGNFSILGMPGTSYRFTLDGMDLNDSQSNTPWSGVLSLLLGQNQIHEATVVSTGYSGQFGGAAGGNITYITKSGTNQLHGNAQYFWNGRILNANDWYSNNFQQPRPFNIANQWALSLGGPIAKNKLFFFFDTEGLRVLAPQGFPVQIPSPEFETATLANIYSDKRFGPGSVTYAFYRRIFDLYDVAPGASSAKSGSLNPDDPSGCSGFPQLNGVTCTRYFFLNRSRPSQDTLAFGRLDWVVSGTDRTSIELQHDGGHFSSYTDPISSVFDGDFNQSWWQGHFIETHSFCTSAGSHFLVAGSYIAPINGVRNPSDALAEFPTTLSFVSLNFNNLGGLDNLLIPRNGRHVTQFQFSEDFVKTMGRQKMGFGINFERTYWKILVGVPNGIGALSVQTLDAFYQGGLDPISPEVDFTRLDQSFTSRTSHRVALYNFGLYSQDEWHARSDLVFTLALRAERQSNPFCPSGCFARMAGPFESVGHDPDQPYNQAILINQKRAVPSMDGLLWSPRFSFAWQPLGVSHATVIRGGVGIFYDPALPFAGIFSSNPPLLNSFSVFGDNLTPGERTNLFRNAADSNVAFLDGFDSGKTLAQIQRVFPTFSPPGITLPAKRTHLAQYQRWSLELQQAFGIGTSVRIGYFGHHGIHELVQDPDANAYGFASLPADVCTSPPVLPCADSRFSGVTQMSSNAVSYYNGMVISFQGRLSRWSQGLFQANYTYGHALDEKSNGGDTNFNFRSSMGAQDPMNLHGAYGAADYDVRHSFNASYVWEVPVRAFFRGHGPRALVEGWQVSGTIFARTGFPYTVFDFRKSGQLASNNYFGALYAVPVGPLGPLSKCGKGAAGLSPLHPCQPPQLLSDQVTPNPEANFVQTTCETGFNVGNLPGPNGPCAGPPVFFAQGRNHFRGPGYFNTDLTVIKNTKIPSWENATLGIGFQFFNFFNHPNFGIPDNGIDGSTFGLSTYMPQPPTVLTGGGFGANAARRMIQVKAQLQF